MAKMNLAQKLLEIQKSLSAFKPEGSGHGYKYITGSQVLNHIRPMMNELGLLLKVEVLDIENTRNDYTTRNGSRSEILSKVSQRMTWIDTESGEREECLFMANGQNDWDKGLGSALTYGERYFLLKFFHIPTDEDDVDFVKRDKASGTPYSTSTPTRTQEDDNKPWLNLFTKDGKVTTEFDKIIAANEKSPLTLATIRKKYKVNKASAAELEKLGIK